MRKTSAIVLLFVFFLYHLGYYGIYLTTRYQLDHIWEDKILNEQITSEETLIASIPLAIPYQSDQHHFHPASGTFEINGRFFRIVKQRYAKDTLHIMYVNDTTLENLNQSLSDWISSLTQKPTSEKGEHQLWKTIAKDFLLLSSHWEAIFLIKDYTPTYGDAQQLSFETTLDIPPPPPEA